MFHNGDTKHSNEDALSFLGDQKNETQSNSSQANRSQDFQAILTCPLTKKIFYDAIFINGCGHTYEKSALVKYSKANKSCPECKQPFQDQKFSPAPAINNMVELLLKAKPELQAQRYFSLTSLQAALENNENVEIEKLGKILQSSANELNRIRKKDHRIGMSAVYWLAATGSGQELLIKDEILRNKITKESLNSVDKNGVSSAVIFLLATPIGRKILLADNARLCKLIDSKVLSDLEYHGTPVLQWLCQTPEGKKIVEIIDPVPANKAIRQLEECVRQFKPNQKDEYKEIVNNLFNQLKLVEQDEAKKEGRVDDLIKQIGKYITDVGTKNTLLYNALRNMWSTLFAGYPKNTEDPITLEEVKQGDPSVIISSRHLFSINSLVNTINRRGTYANPLTNGKFDLVDRGVIQSTAARHGLTINTNNNEQKQHGPAEPTDLDRDAIERLQAADAAELQRRGLNR